MASFLSSILVGVDRVSEPVAPVRDPRQHAALAAIQDRADFVHFLNNPFTAEVGGYSGPFAQLFRTTNNDLHCVRVGKTGRILQHVSVADDETTTVHVSR